MAPGAPAQSWARAKAFLPLAAILLGSAALRLAHLGYSHFQGDEISALYPLGVPFPESLLEQLKGPVQLLVTLAVRQLTGGFGEVETRLPFSLASLLTVYVVYLFVRDSFGKRPALFAAALVGSCGLLVAFGRIAQYQAFVMLAVSASAWLLMRWVTRDDARFLYLGMAFFAGGVLSHYDALTFLPALLILLAMGVRRRETRTKARLGHVFLASGMAVLLVSVFYAPFVLRPGFASVSEYLEGRVVGGLGWQTFVRTRQLLALYLPPLYLPVVAALAAVGAAAALTPGSRLPGIVVIAWFAAPFCFYMFLGGQPRSHVYMYMLPGMILAALGLQALLSQLRSPLLARCGMALACAAAIAFAAISYYTLVDHRIEHPWERKTVLGYALPNLVEDKIQGVFGFPYRRGLGLVGDLFRSGDLRGTFDSNERDATVEFYIDAPRSSPPLTYFDDPGSVPPDYYVFVHRPFSLRRELPQTVQQTYRLIETIRQEGRTTIEIYAAPWMDS